MKSREAGIALALVLIVLAVVWWRTDGIGGGLACGGRTLAAADAVRCITLSTVTDGALGGRYDGTQQYLGLAFAVPAGQELVVTRLTTTADAAAPITVIYGWGDSDVADSVAAPALARTAGGFTVPATGAAADGHRSHEAVFIVPAGKYLWARMSGAANWPGRVQMVGYLR